MRSWKLILCLLLAVVVLVGCGKTQGELDGLGRSNKG